MRKRKNPIPPDEWAALQARWAETQRLMAAWLAQHEAKLADRTRRRDA